MPKSNSDADIAKAVEYGKTVKLYPLSAAAKPGQTTFVDVKDIVMDGTIPYNKSFFESLDRIMQSEPWLERDKAMIEKLKSIGIEKGKAFNPDEKMLATLNAALQDARTYLNEKYEGYTPFYSDKKWFVAANPELFKSWANSFNVENSYPIEGRGVTYFWGYSSLKRAGEGMHQVYLFSTRDKDGNAMSGDKNYQLIVPANVPANQYWSVTAYNFDTHTLIRDVAVAARSSYQADLQKNADGSITMYFGAKAPQGKETNWIPTKAGEKFELIFRCYGVEKPLMDKTWVLNDLEEVK